MTVDAHKYSLLKYIFKWIPGDLLHPQQLDMNEYLNSIRKHGFHTEFTERIKKGKLFDHYFIVARKTQIWPEYSAIDVWKGNFRQGYLILESEHALGYLRKLFFDVKMIVYVFRQGVMRCPEHVEGKEYSDSDMTKNDDV